MNENARGERPAPIRWGVLATGGIAEKFAQDLKYVPDAEAAAVGSRREESARSFASRFGFRRAHGSYEALASDPNVDAIYVATPHPGHHQSALLCLNAGKAVLCEKPLTINLKEATELFDAAERKGVFLMEALWTYFLPALRKAAEWIKAGEIGEPRLIEASFGFKSEHDPHSRWLDPTLGGGALLDLGVYPLSLTQFILGIGKPEISAQAFIGSTSVDETTLMQLRYPKGVLAQLSCSLNHDLSNEAIISGTRGSIRIPSFWTARGATLKNEKGTLSFEDSRASHGYNYEAEAVGEHLRAGEKGDSLINRDYSLRLMATMDEIRRQIGLKYPGE